MIISDNCFVVTGGASGLGSAVVEMLVDRGAKVVIADLPQAENVALKFGPNAQFVATDILDEEEGRRAVAMAVERFGGVAGLVNCAGILIGEKILSRKGPHSLENFARVVNVNLIGTFNMMRLAAQAMADGKPNADGERGVIVNTASIAAYDGQIGQVAYAASKGGVVSLTLAAARELAAFGIRVVTVAPGMFHTAMMDKVPDDARAALTSGVPFPPRFGRPSEFAALVGHILENCMLNGEVIRLDGAARMAAK